MPKAPPRRSTKYRADRFERILLDNVTMPTPCGRCKEKATKCIVELSTGFCLSCIRARVRCDLHLSRTEWDEIKSEQRIAELRVAKAEAELANARLALLESKEKERRRILEDIASTEELEELENAAGLSALAPVVEPDPPNLGADSGWLQANFDSFLDSSFLLAASPSGLGAVDWPGGSPPPVSEPAVSSNA